MPSKFIGQEAELVHCPHLQVFSSPKFTLVFVFETKPLEGGRKIKGMNYWKTDDEQVTLFVLK